MSSYCSSECDSECDSEVVEREGEENSDLHDKIPPSVSSGLTPLQARQLT